jgi:tetratricopeptide (TPR) repeat protein
MTDRDALLERALSLSEEGDWAGSAELLLEHLEDFDEDPAVYCWLGVSEREMGLEGMAYERFKRALALGTEDPYVLATAGNGIAAFDDPEAEQALRTAALIAPDVALTRLMYGAYLAREGFHADSLRELQAARELDPEDPQIAYVDPEDGWARIVFGLELIEIDRMEEGTGELLSGARLREEDVDAQLAAALAAAATGRDGIAYEMLERARIRAAEADLVLVTAVEDRLEGGHEASLEMLTEDLVPDMLRTRMSERP